MLVYIDSAQFPSCSLLTRCAQLMGLAVYNSITLDIRFPLCVYKKLLTPPIVPCDFDAPVGMASLTLDDLQQIMPVCTQAVTSSFGVSANTLAALLHFQTKNPSAKICCSILIL